MNFCLPFLLHLKNSVDFSFSSKYFLISRETLLTHVLFINMLFDLQLLGDFLAILLLRLA